MIRANSAKATVLLVVGNTESRFEQESAALLSLNHLESSKY